MVAGATAANGPCRASKDNAAALPKSWFAMRHTAQQISMQKVHCASSPRDAASHAALLTLAP
eukprot:15299590-Alexandrium_andersonii.AAC.1